MCVDELMIPNTAAWDGLKLNQLLLPFEVQRVLDTRISPNKPPDIWYWGLEKDGVYTVRSAYKMLVVKRSPHELTLQPGSEVSILFVLFVILILSRVSICFGIVGWQNGSGMAWSGELTAGRGGDVKEWVEMCWKNMCMEEGARLMVGCWAIWEHRNKVVFDNATVFPVDVIRRAKDVMQESVECEGTWIGGGRNDKEGARREKTAGWRPARDGFVKINVDAGVKEGEGVGTGIVCRDSNGDVLWGLSIGRDQCWEVHFAEATAIMDGLEEAAAHGIRKVEMESDCLPVIEAIRDKQTGRSMFHQLLDDIIMFSSNFESVVWSYVSRVNNCVAHGLAHCIPRAVGKVIWEDGLPPSVNSAVIFDRSLIE
ncbi:uncharacterized protein LOC141654806 [Silene latifolia]|uniref:uncharacterized protein LOC141654806 n=1 Tax=Silene latifolia TaxID=37657 RepID=UPI003D781BDB